METIVKEGVTFEKGLPLGTYWVRIDEALAERIMEKNEGYITLADGNEIAGEDLINNFTLNYYPDRDVFCLSLDVEDYYIEDIVI